MNTVGTPAHWLGFLAFVLALLFADLFLLHREAKPVSPKSAIRWTCVWVSLAAAFCALVYVQFGEAKALEFATGYLIEEALSVDNLFVFLVLFKYFRVPLEQQRRVLFWGVLGALLMRAACILAGTALISQFRWLLYLFGAFLVITGARLLTGGGDSTADPGDNTIVRWLRRIMPVTGEFHGARFSIVKDGKRWATPLLLVLITIEISDVIFALDSLPAIFAITLDPFIVFTSNIFAILGLRTLFFLLSSMLGQFRFLRVGLSVVLIFIGGKMLLAHFVQIPIAVSLGVVAGALAVAVVTSMALPEHRARGSISPDGPIGSGDPGEPGD